MFVAIYQFDVKPNHEQKFIESWEGLTQLIYQYEDSLGSRLHKNKDGTYIAYAQWPNKATWKNSGDKLPEEAVNFRNQMKASCASISTLFELEDCKDLLKNEVFNA